MHHVFLNVRVYAYQKINLTWPYKSKQLGSTFIEVIQNKETFIVGCIYIHPSMEISDFKK